MYAIRVHTQIYILQHDLKIYRYHMPATMTGEENKTNKYSLETPNLAHAMLNLKIIPTHHEYILNIT